MTSTDNNAVCSCGVLNRKFMYSVLAVPGTKLFRWFYRYWLTIASNSTETFQNTPSQPTKTFHTTVTNKMKFSRPALLVALYGYGILKNDTVDAQQPFRVRAALVRSLVGWLVRSYSLLWWNLHTVVTLSASPHVPHTIMNNTYHRLLFTHFGISHCKHKDWITIYQRNPLQRRSSSASRWSRRSQGR